MKLLPVLLLLIGTGWASGITVKDYFHTSEEMYATVTWTPRVAAGSSGGEVMDGYDPASGQAWATINGGFAFLDVFCTDDGFRLETWDTDTNGQHTPDRIDFLYLDFDPTNGFALALEGSYSGTANPFRTYKISALEDNAYGFSIEYCAPVPDTNSILTLLIPALSGLVVAARLRHKTPRPY